MNDKIYNIRQKFTNNKKKLLIGLVVVLALSMPFIVNQVLKQQDVRQRADSAPAIKVYFGDYAVMTPTPVPNGVIRVGDTVNIELKVDTSTNDIGGFHFKMTYPTEFVNNLTSLLHPYFTEISKTSIDGSFDTTIVNPTINQITGQSISFTKLQFHALKAGSVTFTLSDIQATASKYDTWVPIDPTSTLTKTITIAESGSTISVAPDPIGDDCSTLTAGRPDNCTCDTNAQCTSNDCRTASDGAIPPPGVDRSQKVCWSQSSPTPTFTPTPTSTPIPEPTATPTPVATLTPIPTATIPPGSTTLALTVTLPGIGNGNGRNATPIHSNRKIKIVLSDFTSKTQVGDEFESTLAYDATSGSYKGVVLLDPTLPTGAYDIKIKMDNTLYKKQYGITITKAVANTMPATYALVPSDLDQDNALRINDYTLAVACFQITTPAPACTDAIRARFDINDNGVTKGDVKDFVLLQNGFATILEGD